MILHRTLQKHALAFKSKIAKPFLFSILIAFPLILGLAGIHWYGQIIDGMMRERFEGRAPEIARTIKPERIKSLLFTLEDRKNPVFLRLREQMTAYGKTIDQKSIYSVASKNGQLVFGPENLPENDPMAASPGTPYFTPPPELVDIFRNKQPITIGPYTDEYGTFISAFTPILDPLTLEVLIVIGIDIDVSVWQNEILDKQLFLGAILLVILSLLGGSVILVRKRHQLPYPQRSAWMEHVETLLTAFCGIALTIAFSHIVNQIYTHEKSRIFTLSTEHIHTALNDEFMEISNTLESVKNLFESSSEVTRDEFSHFTSPILQKSPIKSIFWMEGSNVPAAKEMPRTTFANARQAETITALFKNLPECHDALRQAENTRLSSACIKQNEIITFLPVYNRQDQNSTSPPIQKGIAGLSFSFGKIALRHQYECQHKTLFDIFDISSNQTLHKNSANYYTGNIFSETYPLFFFGKTFALAMTPGDFPRTTNTLLISAPAFTALGGLSITFSLTLMVFFLRRRQISLERTVNRTNVSMSHMVREQKTISDAILDAVIALDPEGNILHMNPAAEILLGQPMKTIQGTALGDHLRMAGKDDPYLRPFPAGIPLSKAEIHRINQPLEILSSDGKNRKATFTMAPVHDETGIKGWVAVFHDMTGLANSQAMVRRRLMYETGLAEFTNILLTESPGPQTLKKGLQVLLHTTETCRGYIFDNFMDEKLGLCERQILKMVNPEQTFGPNTSNFEKVPVFPHFQDIYNTLSTGQVFTANIVNLPDVQKRFFQAEDVKSVILLPIFSEQEMIGFIGFSDCLQEREWDSDDINLLLVAAKIIGVYRKNARNAKRLRVTNRQLNHSLGKAEQLAQLASIANTAKSEFIACMSHELRTPLNIVIAGAEIIEKQLFGNALERYTSYAHDIRTSGLHLLDIINDILDLSKIEAGKLGLDIGPFNFHHLLAIISQNMVFLSQNKNIDFILDLSPDIPHELKGDMRHLKQILINLGSNAIKFTEMGHIKIIIRKEAETEKDITLLIEVSDTGIGIPEEHKNEIFHPFKQVDSSLSRKYGGTGLGLAISKELVELMGGQIGFRSMEGKGTTFWLKVPFAKLDA
ncbi:MAG TPA: hypothetical protein DCW68_03925 [Rhodospirillaceae bacterium]|nr:MAG: hypothetical protein A2018_07110 [Alphaproteobacteria bacterium GWF2_58_20]HAU29243.1 hypothetical protein [Rhodospirillaceae bacterium]